MRRRAVGAPLTTVRLRLGEDVAPRQSIRTAKGMMPPNRRSLTVT